MEWTARHETDAFTIQNIAWCIYIFFSFFSLRMRIEIASCNERALTLTFATFSHSLKTEKEWHAKRTKRNNSRTKQNDATQNAWTHCSNENYHYQFQFLSLSIWSWFVSLSSTPSPAYILWIENAKNMTCIAVRLRKRIQKNS